jgi:AcrR family transcriptional regulator
MQSKAQSVPAGAARVSGGGRTKRGQSLAGDPSTGSALKAVAAMPDPTELVEGELRKSGATRRRIMESAVYCLARYGYAGVNAVTVAEHAQLTRPAMLYHFPTRLALIEAAIHFVVQRRIEAFEEAVSRIAQRGDNLEVAVLMAWRQNDGPLYHAYCELANAARTDPDLQAIFGPAMLAYDRARRLSALKLFSDAEQAKPGFHLRRDAVRFLLDGMATHGAWIENRDERIEALVQLVLALTMEPEADVLLTKAMANVKPIAKRPGARRRRGGT